MWTTLLRWLWQPQKPEPTAVDAAATAVAVAVAVAATVQQSTAVAHDVYVNAQQQDKNQSKDITQWADSAEAIREHAVGYSHNGDDQQQDGGSGEVHVGSVWEGAMAVEKAAIKSSAELCVSSESAPVRKFAPARESTAEKDYLDSSLKLLYTIRYLATVLLLQLSGIPVGLVSCFERSKREYYKSRIHAWNIAVKVLVPSFLYAFVLLILLAALEEPWYMRGAGMCYSRCHNKVDCHANTTIGLVGADNGLARWVNLTEYSTNATIRQLIKDTPACPGVGALKVPQVRNFSEMSDHDPSVWHTSCGCAWLEQVMNVTVFKPVASPASHNTTVCEAVVRLVDNFTGLPPGIGSAVPAVWHSMYAGQNDGSPGERVVALSNSAGYAVFTTPLNKPFNRSGGHGCKLTVLAYDNASFAMNPWSVLHNHISWGHTPCVDCRGDWVLVSPCDAMCESNGTKVEAYVVSVVGTMCGAPCGAADGQNRSLPCSNDTFCNCTGMWYESRGCDAKCESWGTKTLTYHITKPAMSRMVGGKLLPGAPCPAKDLQTKDVVCNNTQKCTLDLHADVSLKSAGGQGPVVHADLVPTPHGPP
jgi:hypothetical protein